MLYWYSGTGNSRYVAAKLAKLIGEPDCRFIPSELGVKTDAAKQVSGVSENNFGGETLGFCFPVYSWGVPPIVMELISALEERVYEDKYIYAILTCGDECGLAVEMLRKALKRRKAGLDAVFTVIMPNDYVMLPGFDVDSKEVEQRKILASEVRIREIGEIIRRKESKEDVHRGPMPWLKTKLVYPLFKRWGVQTGRWKVDSDKCISCRKCEKVCPAGNIVLRSRSAGGKSRYPNWGKNCYSCTACYQICPERAIDYGIFTQGKKQYFFPSDLTVD